VSDHQIEIVRYYPPGKRNSHYSAICSCGRWRSDPYREREHAESKGLMHVARGDEHNRALAAEDRGNAQIRTTYKWYLEQSEDPRNSEEHRRMWHRLAEEIRGSRVPHLMPTFLYGESAKKPFRRRRWPVVHTARRR